MRRNSTSSIGALHPVLFMLLVYVISIVLAFFVCRMIYFSINGTTAATDDEQPLVEVPQQLGTVTAAR